MFGKKAREIAALNRTIASLKADSAFGQKQLDTACKMKQEYSAKYDEAMTNYATLAADFEKVASANEALNDENQDMHEEIRYLSCMVGLYESVLKQLRVPVKLPARKK
jgi:chromosome segregation ATPase